MCGFKFDPSKTGLRKTLREYEELALRYVWETGDEGAGSGSTWRAVNERLEEGKTISRASIIFFQRSLTSTDTRSTSYVRFSRASPRTSQRQPMKS